MKKRDIISLLALLAVSSGYNASLQNNRQTFLSLEGLGLRPAVAAVPGDLTLPTPIPTPTKPQMAPTPEPSFEALEVETIRHINAHRGAHGLAPLFVNTRMSAVARAHSKAMAAEEASFGHDGFDERMENIATFQPHSYAAENVARTLEGERAAEQGFALWKNSAGHNKNMLGPATHAGLGVAHGRKGVFFTLVLVK